MILTLLVSLSCKEKKEGIDKNGELKYSITNGKTYIEIGTNSEIILHSKNLGERLLKITTRGKSSFSNTYSSEQGFHMTINAQEDNIKDSFYEIYLTEVLNSKDTIDRFVKIPVEIK
ncbi:hypothetical protein [Polaribacter sp. Z022]|jgi:hypothetical protein|uniref:hypothetical protein n=1 Tax=Polaribacter sp. Z022 TaxID=2927125 RepID=UPI002021B708|nr:hypothetical protein [Polaribacter sp. Z022]MCL7755140.1 hypothetical protein [Polaribacter sp. Z022]